MLKGENVNLTLLRSGDLPILFNWINDRDQVLFNAAYKPVSDTMHQAWFESIQNCSHVVLFGIRLAKTDELIGSCQLRDIDLVHRTAQLQIRIGKVEQHGHGYGTEAVGMLLGFAFNDMNLHRVYLQVFATNAAAIRAYEKAGFTREGLIRQGAYIDGRYLDSIMMGFLKEEYSAQRNIPDS